jgi:hypothetical protein
VTANNSTNELKRTRKITSEDDLGPTEGLKGCTRPPERGPGRKPDASEGRDGFGGDGIATLDRADGECKGDGDGDGDGE